MAVKKSPDEARVAWLRVRFAWARGRDAFLSAMTGLTKKEMAQLYDVVCHSLYKESYVQILRENPALKDFLKSDEDRLCMHDIYGILSVRLHRHEPLPEIEKATLAMKGGIGRDVPRFGY